jgi:hypothetical protein
MSNIKFPMTTSIKKWSKYLGRKLFLEEFKLLESLKTEIILNKMIYNLYKIIDENNKNEDNRLYIPLLTQADGNCLFESLVYYNIGNDINSLKISISYFMYQLQNVKLPGQEETLKEKFFTFFCDDIDYVIDNSDKKIYKYSYNVMCKDLCCKDSWKRIPTNLILILISWLFNCKIIIISDNTNYKNIINVYENINLNIELKEIYLGKLGGEFHYIPLDILSDNENIIKLKHDKIKKIFLEWAEEVSEDL